MSKLSTYDRETLSYLKAEGIDELLLKRVEKSLVVKDTIGNDSDVLADLIVHLEDDFKDGSSVQPTDLLKFLKDRGVKW